MSDTCPPPDKARVFAFQLGNPPGISTTFLAFLSYSTSATPFGIASAAAKAQIQLWNLWIEHHPEPPGSTCTCATVARMWGPHGLCICKVIPR
jgi:hypothetical protein